MESVAHVRRRFEFGSSRPLYTPSTLPHRGESFYDDNMKWEKDGSSVEIRTQGELPDGRPALDEVVASGATVHLEQMSHDHWWMGLEAGGKYFHLNFGVQDGRLWVRLSDQGEEDAEWEGDSREKPWPGSSDHSDS